MNDGNIIFVSGISLDLPCAPLPEKLTNYLTYFWWPTHPSVLCGMRAEEGVYNPLSEKRKFDWQADWLSWQEKINKEVV